MAGAGVTEYDNCDDYHESIRRDERIGWGFLGTLTAIIVVGVTYLIWKLT